MVGFNMRRLTVPSLAVFCLLAVPMPGVGQTRAVTPIFLPVQPVAAGLVWTSPSQDRRWPVVAERPPREAKPPQSGSARDSLKNGAIIGALIGGGAFGAFAGFLCHLYQEKGGPSCVPDALRFVAIGGAIGAGAGLAVDALLARRSAPPRSERDSRAPVPRAPAARGARVEDVGGIAVRVAISF